VALSPLLTKFPKVRLNESLKHGASLSFCLIFIDAGAITSAKDCKMSIEGDGFYEWHACGYVKPATMWGVGCKMSASSFTLALPANAEHESVVPLKIACSRLEFGCLVQLPLRPTCRSVAPAPSV
jgi:hypothetical protein